MNKAKYNISIHWNNAQEQKRTKYSYIRQMNKSKKLCWMKEARWENIHIVWFHLYKTLEKTPWSIVTKSRSVIASGWTHGEGQERKITKELEGTSGTDGCVHHFDCGDGFTCV